MMKKGNIIRTIKVGVFVVLAIALLTSLIFYIGSKQHVLGSKKEVVVIFRNVGGLKTGNSIRFAGVSIGTVDDINIISDTSVVVTMAIDTKNSKFIKEDSKVSISTEGLLGSKYIRIFPGTPEAKPIRNGDQLTSIEPIDMDNLLYILNESGNNVKSITANVDQIVTKINDGKGTLGAIISDPQMNNKVSEILNSFGATGNNASELTKKMMEVVDPLKEAGENSVIASEELKEFTYKLNNDSSTLGTIINDDDMAKQIYSTLDEMEATAENVKETSTRIGNSWIIRLFSKKNKKE